MKNKLISLLLVVLISIPIGICTYDSQHQEKHEQKISFEKYIEKPIDAETEAMGVEQETDFVLGYYPNRQEYFDPYSDVIVKNIEATAYCHGEVTCTGKKVREGYAAMSKQYLGMTAVVYEADENGKPLNYIGTYEIEDTGGDYRIKNGTCIDIYISDYDAAVEFGRKQVVAYIIEAKG